MIAEPAVRERRLLRRAAGHGPRGNARARPFRQRGGIVAVEFALTLPLFLLLTIGILEFGRAFSAQQMLTHAAREGARHGVLPNATTAEVTQKVQECLAAGGINDQRVAVTVTPVDLDTARTGAAVTVRVVAPYAAISWLSHPWFLGDTNLSTQCVMRHE